MFSLWCVCCRLLGAYICMCVWIHMSFSCAGVEFGARMISIDGKQIKLQIWDTVSSSVEPFILAILRCLTDV